MLQQEGQPEMNWGSIGRPTGPKHLSTVCHWATRVAVVLLLIGLHTLPAAEAKGIYATVEAPWAETPLLAEGCEWVAQTLQYEPQPFFECVEAAWRTAEAHSKESAVKGRWEEGARGLTQKEQYDVLRGMIRSMATVSLHMEHLFQVEMAARVYSPAVEAHYVLATNDAAAYTSSRDGERTTCRGKPFILLYRREEVTPQVVYDAQALPTSFASPILCHANCSDVFESIFYSELDHVHRHSKPVHAAAAVIILYGLIGEVATRSLYEAALAAARNADVHIIFRHLPVDVARACGATTVTPSAESSTSSTHALWDSPLYVQGYGATVDFKSTEYKVVNERGDGSSSGSSTVASRNTVNRTTLSSHGFLLGGVSMATLLGRYPNLTPGSLDDALRAVDGAMAAEEIKVDLHKWELKNLGLAIVRLVSETKAEDRLSKLNAVVSHLPRYAPKLATIAADPAQLEGVILELQELRYPFPPNGHLLFLDQKRVDMKDMDYHSVLQIYRKETLLDDRMHTAVTSRWSGSCEDASSAPMGPCLERVAVADDTITAIIRRIKESIFANAQSKNSADSLRSRSRLLIPHRVTSWVNNMETAPFLQHFPVELSAALHPQMVANSLLPRRNLLNVVILHDSTEVKGLKAVLEYLQIVASGLQARIGIVPVDTMWKSSFTSDLNGVFGMEGKSALSPTALCLSAVLYEVTNSGHENAVKHYMEMLLKAVEDKEHSALSEEKVRKVSDTFLKKEGIRSLDNILGDASFMKYYHDTQSVLSSFRFPVYPSVLLNGLPLELGVQGLVEVLPTEMQIIRTLIHRNILRDDMVNLYDTILTSTGATQRYQPALNAPTTWVAMEAPAALRFLLYRPTLLPSVDDSTTPVPLVSNTVLLPAVSTLETLEVLQRAIHSLDVEVNSLEGGAKRTPSQLMVAVCGASGSTPNTKVNDVNATVATTLETLMQAVADRREGSRMTILSAFTDHVLQHAERLGLPVGTSLSDTRAWQQVHQAGPLPPVVEKALREDIPLDEQVKQAKLVKDMCTHVYQGHSMQLKGSVLLLTNGHALPVNLNFTAEDFAEWARRHVDTATVAFAALEAIDFPQLNTTHGFTPEELDTRFFSARTAAFASIIVKYSASKDKREEADDLVTRMSEGAQLTRIDVSPLDGETPKHHLTVVLDPAARSAQRLVALSDYFHRSPLGVAVTIYLCPSTNVQKPIRDEYTFVARHELVFDADSGAVVPPGAVFDGLPDHLLLTLGMEEPESWTIMQHHADHDLDNIVLANLPRDDAFVVARYRIHSLLVTGEATDPSRTRPLNGLPLTLTPISAHAKQCDTLVMSIVAYYQLRSTPGVWILSIQPGPVAEQYAIHSVNGIPVALPQSRADSAHEGTSLHRQQRIPVVVRSFNGLSLSLTAGPPPGGNDTPLHELLEKLARSRKLPVWPPERNRGHKSVAHRPERPTLNIFSVASGHLYERFLRMMLHSVYTASSDRAGGNTTRIKFWLIENFLSPQFKEVVPLMAKKYGFEVELVTYHWPWWLPAQSEKQRTIWAYKVLFLDVLFPLSVDRVIFVDADQTVLSDLHELYYMDIGAHILAMTPFCVKNANKQTTNFRFWNSGFWKKHLRGKPYHISAIFMVDLQQLRATRAGDRYRMVYSQLSNNADSLANLDQDLPNYLQDEVPIFSLPEEWLWCETWCNGASKAKAKTIDLCNNPLTKVPKLDNARSIIPKWDQLDRALETMQQELLEAARGTHTQASNVTQ